MRGTSSGIHRDPLDRLRIAARAYRVAFDQLEQAIATEYGAEPPPWLGTLHQLDLDDLVAVCPAVGRAEQRRRACRVALHAVAELIALEEATWGEATPPEWESGLDRFVTVMSYAESSGCQYVNGTFEPIVFHDQPVVRRRSAD